VKWGLKWREAGTPVRARLRLRQRRKREHSANDCTIGSIKSTGGAKTFRSIDRPIDPESRQFRLRILNALKKAFKVEVDQNPVEFQANILQ